MKGSEGNTSQKVHLTRSERCDIIDRLSHGKAKESGKNKWKEPERVHNLFT